MNVQWPAVGPTGAPGARLAPARELAEVEGDRMRGLATAPIQGHNIMGDIAPGVA